MKAPFGWTVIMKANTHRFTVYKRDTDVKASCLTADLIPFTFPTKAKAMTAGHSGYYRLYGESKSNRFEVVDLKERNTPVASFWNETDALSFCEGKGYRFGYRKLS